MTSAKCFSVKWISKMIEIFLISFYWTGLWCRDSYFNCVSEAFGYILQFLGIWRCRTTFWGKKTHSSHSLRNIWADKHACCPPSIPFYSSRYAPILSWPMVGTAVWSPPPHHLPFSLQRAISCAEKRPGWEGAGGQVGPNPFPPSGSNLPQLLPPQGGYVFSRCLFFIFVCLLRGLCRNVFFS